MKIQTSVRVEETFYKEAKEIFSKFGLTFGDAVNIFLAKVALEKGIPFEISVPSDELHERYNNNEQNKNIEIFNSANDLFEDLGI